MPKKRPRREVWSVNPKFSREVHPDSLQQRVQVVPQVKELCGESRLDSETCDGSEFNVKKEFTKLQNSYSFNTNVAEGMPPSLRERKPPVRNHEFI